MYEAAVGPNSSITENKLSLGHSVLNANGIENAHPVITGNYIGPDHELPLPYPEGDWYLRQTFVPAVSEGETVVCHSLIPGLLEYYHDIGLVPDSARVIEVDPETDGLNYGFPGTDPLEILRGNFSFEENGSPNYLCSTFDGQHVNAQASDLGLNTLERAESSLANHKAHLREAASEYGFTMLPGVVLRDWQDLELAADKDWNTGRGSWLKYPTGSGGDLVIKLTEEATPEILHEAVSKLRDNVRRAFLEGQFAIDFDEFWPGDALSPKGYPLVCEADVSWGGELMANGSTQFLAKKIGEAAIIGHFIQITSEAGEYLGNEPFADIDAEVRQLAEIQTSLVADYSASEHGYYGIAAIDWFLTMNEDGQSQLSVVELNARPTANTPPVIIAEKLDAPHFVNTNVYTDRPIHNIYDFIAVVGEDLAYGEPRQKGMVVPQAFRTLVRGGGAMTTPSPNFKVAILGNSSEHCHGIIQELRGKGVRFEP